jgi:glucose/arabinose dehydrogenase
MGAHPGERRGNERLGTICATFALLVLAATRSIDASAGSARPSGRLAPAITAVPVATGLDFPAGFTFAPDGRIFYGERFTGEIRIFDPGTGSDTLFATIPNLVTNGERGLLGLALHPQYQSGRPFLYVYATRRTQDGSVRNQIIRIRDAGGTGASPKIVFSGDTIAGDAHDGGRILFGPDGYLYAIQGEGQNKANSQDLTNHAGKVFRMDGLGHAPPDNPFLPTLIWAYGIRNSFGFTFDPLNGNLWETEPGPRCNDEINLVVKGANYAWGPAATCFTPPDPPDNTNQDGPDRVFPVVWFQPPTITPVGAAFCHGCGLGVESEDTLFFGIYDPPHEIFRAPLTPDRTGIESITSVYHHTSGILSLENGPDGSLYFSDFSAIWRLVG